MPFVDAGGTRLFHRFDGSPQRPVLVLSNSLGSDLRMWDAQVPAFAERFRVLRYDSRGHGQSAVPPGPYRIEDLGRDLLALLDALGLERVHFCGLSKGGMVGMWLAVNAPDRVERLVLCNTSAYLGPPELWNARIEAVRQSGMPLARAQHGVRADEVRLHDVVEAVVRARVVRAADARVGHARRDRPEGLRRVRHGHP